jgi:hypothetical protein
MALCKDAMALFQRSKSSDTDVKEVAENTPMSVGDPVALLAVASVVYSWYLFYMEENEERGIFVGLWAPTLLTASNYLQQKHLIEKFKSGLSPF